MIEIEEVIDNYRKYASFPTVSRAHIGNADTVGHTTVHSVWDQRDLERSEKVTFSEDYIVHLNEIISTPCREVKSEVWNKESPSGRYRAILRKIKDAKGDEKQYIEIWKTGQKAYNIAVDSLDSHGKIYDNDGHFGCFEWSSLETHLLYTAEKKIPKSKSFFEKKNEEKEDKKEAVIRGEEHVFRDHWGEQMYTKHHPVICVLNIEAAAVRVIDNLPENVSAGQAVWCPGDNGIVCVGWNHDPYKLGIIYCPMRRSALYYVDLQAATCVVIGNSNQSVRSPVFSPDKSKLVYLENPACGPHQQCSKLMMCDWTSKQVSTVIDIVRKPSGDGFAGLYLLGLIKRCWSLDNKRVLATTYWRSMVAVVVINTETGQVTRVTQGDQCLTLKDVHRDLVLCSSSSPSQPDTLVLGSLPGPGKETEITWTCLQKEPVVLSEISWKVIKLNPAPDQVNPKYSDLDFECILLQPMGSTTPRQEVPLVVFPHGGPHTTFPASYQLYFSCLCRCGYAVLLVNYRGSLGFGQDSIDSLLGNVGSQDVGDVQYAAEQTLQSGLSATDRVVVIGGSHGGFLTGHLIGQYPGFYKAAVMRNPVINVPAMLTTTDIPDWWSFKTGGLSVEWSLKTVRIVHVPGWEMDNLDSESQASYPFIKATRLMLGCCTEAGLDHNMALTPSPSLYEEMWKRSPISHSNKVQTPTMIMLGANDLRVPPSQGHEYRHALMARGVPVRTIVYEGNSHPIIKVDSEADAFVNIIQWFQKYLPQS